jgi:hypothetical protein
MAHYAFLDDNNIVTDVITGRNEDEIVNGISDWEEYYGALRGQRCLRTSYNNNIRKQYAQLGGKYDDVRDEFVMPQPFPSWSLDSNNDWQPPTPRPSMKFMWNEELQLWIEDELVGTLENTDE